MEERRQLAQKLLLEFMTELKPFLFSLGVFDNKKDEMATVREFGNRFYCNLASLENHLNSKDSLSATLIQRYNHEMLLDFFYIFSSQVAGEKVAEFFSYPDRLKENPTLRKWHKIPEGESLRQFIPPWVSNNAIMKMIYKKLSDMAHPNIISMRLNRRKEEFEYHVIIDAIALVVNDISTCFLYEPFRDLVFSEGFDMETFRKNLRQFQVRAFNVLDM